MVSNEKYVPVRSVAKGNRIVGAKYLDTKGRISIWNGKMLRCEHGRVRSRCKDCGGSGICEHGTRRSQCKDCGGSGICEHGRHRSQCKDCGGSGICEHDRQRSKCKECRQSSDYIDWIEI